jgi:hypothetical protein
MRKGLKSTLLTVAVALLGFQAMAMAPTISTVPDVIIGDAETGTNSNDFTFPDALNGNNLVSDDVTSDGGILWTFQNPGGNYSINARTRTDGSAEDLNAPTANYSLTGADDPSAVDADTRTFTFRNIQFSPVGGPNTEPGALPTPGFGEAMTLVASDGTTYTMSNVFMAYIVDGEDALSGSIGEGVYSVDWTDGGTHGWVQNPIFVADGGVVTLSNSTSGICADASAQGTNISGWTSQANYTGSNATYNTIALAANAVYQVRVTANTTATPGNTPLWYVNFQNTLDWYGGTYLFFDNGVSPTPGNNAPLSPGNPSGRQVFEAWMNAPAVGTASFETEVGNASNAQFHDFRLSLDVLDIGVTGNDPYGGAADAGAICWKQIEVTRYDVSTFQVQSTPYNVTNITQPVNAAAGVQNTDPDAVSTIDLTGAAVSTIAYSGGDITITPNNATAWENNSAFFIIQPGDGQNGFNGSADMIDNYPATFDAEQLYRIVYTLQAPDATGESNPPDYFYLGGDAPTNDIITNTYQTTKLNVSGMPKQTAQEFVAFYHGNGGTSATGNFARMRPHMFCGTVPAFIDVTNTGGITISAIRIDKGTF